MSPLQIPDSQSLFHLERISQYVSVPPIALQTPLPALCAAVFSPLLLSYYPPARGIVLGYQNITFSEEPPKSSSKSQKSRHHQSSQNGNTILLQVIDEYCAPFTWATADLLVWRPQKGAWIEGRITHQSSTHITLSYLNAFPVSILKQYLPEGWTYYSPGSSTFSMTGGRRDWGSKNDAGAGSEGYWVDGDGMPVGESTGSGAAVLRVRIRDWDARIDGEGEGRKAGVLGR